MFGAIKALSLGAAIGSVVSAMNATSTVWTGSFYSLSYPSNDCTGSPTAIQGNILGECYNVDADTTRNYVYCKDLGSKIEYGVIFYEGNDVCSEYMGDYFSGATTYSCQKNYNGEGSTQYFCTQSLTPWKEYQFDVTG